MTPKKITQDEDFDFDTSEHEVPASKPITDDQNYLPVYPGMSEKAKEMRKALLKQPRSRVGVYEDTPVIIGTYRLFYKKGAHIVPESVDKILAEKFGITDLIENNPMRIDRSREAQELTSR